MSRPDTIIVGAGICGLQLGALLASDGQRVVVLEKLPHVGGRAFVWHKAGFVVDNGIHLIRFGPRSATAQVFRHLSKPLEFTRLATSHVVWADGQVVDFPTSPTGFLTTAMLSWRERLGLMGVMAKSALQDPSELLETSVADWLDALAISGRARHYLELVSASMQVCPALERSSAGEMLLNMQAVIRKGYSAMYPTRGWRYLYDVLLGTIASQGEVRTSTKVARVVVENGRARGVRLASGEQLDADRVVVSLPCQQLFQILDESLVPADFVRHCQKLRPTAGVSLDYGLERPISDDAGLWYLSKPLSFGIFTSNLCPELAPAGKQLLTWFAPAELDCVADAQQARALLRSVEQALLRLFPPLEGAIAWRRPMRLRMVDGAEVNIEQHRHKRPGFRVPAIDGLLLVGDSLAAAGAGGDVGHESVLECYRHITGREA